MFPTIQKQICFAVLFKVQNMSFPFHSNKKKILIAIVYSMCCKCFTRAQFKRLYCAETDCPLKTGCFCVTICIQYTRPTMQCNAAVHQLLLLLLFFWSAQHRLCQWNENVRNNGKSTFTTYNASIEKVTKPFYSNDRGPIAPSINHFFRARQRVFVYFLWFAIWFVNRE